MANPTTPRMVDYALWYASLGFYVFPIWPMRDGRCTCGDPKCENHGKHPRIKWAKGATRDPREIEKLWTKWPDAGIGIATGPSGLVVFDIDGPEGLQQFHDLLAGAPEPDTLQVRTARGRHLYFRGEAPTSSQKGEKLDVRGVGGYVVAPPSPHASGHVYEFIGRKMLLDLPAELAEFARSRRAPRIAGIEKILGMAPAYLTARNGSLRLFETATAGLFEPPGPELRSDVVSALCTIPASCGREEWWRVGMALHSTGWPEAFDLWRTWSASHPPKYHENHTVSVWKSFKHGGIGLGTLFEIARGYGWIKPQAPLVPLQQVNGNHALPEVLRENTQGGEPKALIKLNERYAAIGDIGGKCLVLGFVPSKVDESIRVPSFQSFKSFSERYANQYVVVKSLNKNGETVEEVKQLGPHWLKWTGRRSYEGIDLVPGAPAVLPGNVLNLWTGFSVLPAQGCWERMKWHICHILAGGNRECAEYILRFAAWAVQHPGARAEVALVFRGGKGSGKGTFAGAMARLFGQHGLQIYSPKHLVGAFNGHLRNCLMLFADEAFWAGDKQGESVLKGMLTEPTLVIEQKGVDAAPWKNRLHVIMAANADWVVPASHDERRYAVFDVSPEAIGNEGYFDALHAELASGGMAAMLWDLQRMDLAGWHPRRIVRTEALRQQKERSLNALGAWWEDLLQNGVLPFHFIGKPRQAKADAILDHARAWSHRSGDVNPTSIGRFLREQKCERLHGRDGNMWYFPTLNDVRRAWELKMGGWRWEVELVEWRDLYAKGEPNPSQTANVSRTIHG